MAPYLCAAAGENARALTRALLLHALTAVCGIPELPRIERTARGKPYFPERPGLFFSWSHTRGLALCGLADRPLGVDIEARRPLRADLPSRILAPDEYREYAAAADRDARLLTYWTLRESYWKYAGTGLSAPLSAPAFRLEAGGTARCDVPGAAARWYTGNGWYAGLCTTGETGLPVAPLWIPAHALPVFST